MPRNISITILFLLLTQFTFAQNATEPKKTDDPAVLREKAVEFLRETSIELGNMRSIENRISFSAEMAGLMWFHDEKEAKAMYAATIRDFKQLLMELDTRLNMAQMPDDDDAPGLGMFFGGGGRSPAERKLRIAMAVRQQISLSLADHDAEMALNFFYESGGLVSNPAFRAQMEQTDKYFEAQLLKQIAESNVAQAAKLGIASLKDGIDGNHIELLKKIYAKDADKGIEFGAAILSRIKSDRKAVKSLYSFSMLLSYGADILEASKKPDAKKPIYSQNDLRDIADRFASVLLDGGDDEAEFAAMGFADQINKYAPGRGAQIRAKYGKTATGMGSGYGTNSANAAANAMANAANSMSNSGSAYDPDAAYEREQARQKELADGVKGISSSVPKEERDTVIAKMRKIIAETPGKDKKIMGLSMLATQVAKAGDKELADLIMRDAERLINPQPKNYRDFLYSWMVSSGYAEANPDKAFPMLSDLIYRANETISAFVKVAEFIDVNEEMVDNGEVQVGMFGGSMIRGMTKEVGLADTTLISLAKADFAKTKALTNTFDRVEVRVLAKMMILRAVLDDKKPKADQDIDAKAEIAVGKTILKK
ncbi:MAG: hypothetical protein WBO10_11995 [Pyrinomonadaceae bacterium]